MMGSMGPTDFYEEDEPVESIVEAFERGEKHETEPPSAGRTVLLHPESTPQTWQVRTTMTAPVANTH